MTINLTHVLVFKTNISSETDKQTAKRLLEVIPEVDEWSVDTEDIDCVLRIVSQQLSAQQIITIIEGGGFQCCELE